MQKSDKASGNFENAQQQIVFRQMEYDMGGVGYGILFVLAGLLFSGCAIAAICNKNYAVAPGGIIGFLFILFGLPLVGSSITRVKITNQEVCLILGPFVLQRIATPDICTLAYSTMTPSIRGRPWSAEIIVLSPRSSSHIRYVARRWVKDEEISGITDPVEKEKQIMQKSAQAYFQSHSSGFHLKHPEGIWLEYTPERAEELRTLFPGAGCFLDSAFEVTL
jgi:hypothetical protein